MVRVSSNVFEDPRSHIVYEDAKTFFASTHEPYDLIVSEPSNPWVSGVATLFSDEFYGHIAHYLRPDGCLCSGFRSTRRISTSSPRSSRRCPHFGAYALYNLNDLDILIVATRAAALPVATGRCSNGRGCARSSTGSEYSRSRPEIATIGDDRTIGPLFNALPVPVNSDFFPFVDLNAPRLRFMSNNALELPRLTSLSIPLLDLLRPDSPVGATLEPSHHSYLNRDDQVRRALAIRRALSSGRLDDLNAVGAITLLLVRTSGDKCADPRVQNAWTTAARNIGAMTATYLNPSELADVWSSVKSTPCYRDANGQHRAWADLFAAVSARNAAEIVTLGTRLVESPVSLSQDDLTYLTTVMAAAYIRLGEMPQARSLLAAQWSRLDHAGEFALALRELGALALTRDTKMFAGARASSRSDETRPDIP